MLSLKRCIYFQTLIKFCLKHWCNMLGHAVRSCGIRMNASTSDCILEILNALMLPPIFIWKKEWGLFFCVFYCKWMKWLDHMGSNKDSVLFEINLITQQRSVFVRLIWNIVIIFLTCRSFVSKRFTMQVSENCLVHMYSIFLEQWNFFPECDILSPLSNGKMDVSGVTYGQTASFSCNQGFVLQGAQTLTCMAFGWSGTPPICQSIGKLLLQFYITCYLFS